MTWLLAALTLLPLLALPLGAEDFLSADAPRLRLIVVQKAVAWLGTPYAYGGTSAEGMDCSGMVHRVYLDAAGRPLPRGVVDLFREGTEVHEPYLPGDLLFFDTVGGPSHVGISLGGERFVHSASQGPLTGVIVSALSERYYRTRFIGARRIIHRLPQVVRFEVGSPPRPQQATLRMAPGQPVRIALAGQEPGGRQLYLKISGAEGEVLARLLSLDERREASFLWFIPGAGEWGVRAEDLQGGELGSLALLPGKEP